MPEKVDFLDQLEAYVRDITRPAIETDPTTSNICPPVVWPPTKVFVREGRDPDAPENSVDAMGDHVVKHLLNRSDDLDQDDVQQESSNQLDQPCSSTSCAENGEGSEQQVVPRKDDSDDDIILEDHLVQGRRGLRPVMDLEMMRARVKARARRRQLEPWRQVDLAQGRERFPVLVREAELSQWPRILTFRYTERSLFDEAQWKRTLNEGELKDIADEFKLHPQGCACAPGECGTQARCSCRRRSTLRLSRGLAANCEQIRDARRVVFQLDCRAGVCGCRARCSNRFTGRGIQKRVQLRLTAGKGMGVLATEFIPKGSFFGEYAGEILLEEPDRHDLTYMYDVCAENNGWPKDFEFHYMLDSVRYGNASVMLNHSCACNLAPIYYVREPPFSLIIPQQGYVAIQDILPGEELTIDYGPNYFKDTKLKCQCGFSGCYYGSPQSPEELREKVENEARVNARREDEIAKHKREREQTRKRLMEPVTIDSD